MFGKMMHQSLLISNLIEHAAKYHADTSIFSREVTGQMTTTNWLQVQQNSKRLANAFTSFNLNQGDRLATIAWNNHRHLESWYAISGSGYVCHTINPRLFPEQLVFIINDAQDKAIFFDSTFLPLIVAIQGKVPTVEKFICYGARDEKVIAALPDVIFYDDLIQNQSAEFNWPQFGEETPSSLCYTSGTTGNPKGVLYSHRSTLLHTMAISLPDSLNLSANDVVMPVVPMFHVNAWGLPYAALMTGCKLVMPGPQLDGPSIYNLLEGEKVTVAAGVPTIWLGLINHMKQNGLTFSTLKRSLVGGSAVPVSLIKEFDEMGVELMQGWGSTEMSPLGTVSKLSGDERSLPKQEQYEIVAKQGRTIFGVDMKLLAEDGTELPWDFEQSGELHVRGHWVLHEYYGGDGAKAFSHDATGKRWFATGDVARMAPDGLMQITDRTKDVIKSGGEWISSIDLENIAMSHPAVLQSAVIAIPHEKWNERPLLIVVKRPGSEVSKQDILDFYEGRITKMHIPDDVEFVDAMPIGATGKVQKSELREKFKGLTFRSV